MVYNLAKVLRVHTAVFCAAVGAMERAAIDDLQPGALTARVCLLDCSSYCRLMVLLELVASLEAMLPAGFKPAGVVLDSPISDLTSSHNASACSQCQEFNQAQLALVCIPIGTHPRRSLGSRATSTRTIP